jgi:hypothetical protein
VPVYLRVAFKLYVSETNSVARLNKDMSPPGKVVAKRKASTSNQQDQAPAQTPLEPEITAVKQPKILPSIARGVGVHHKPRVGRDFQILNESLPQPKPRTKSAPRCSPKGSP